MNPGNIDADPQLLDGIHIAVTSPCRGAGSAAYLSGTDIDGEGWATPPSMGCDEVWETTLIGPLSVNGWAVWPKVAEGRPSLLKGQVTGRATRVGWWFGDGSMLTNASALNVGHAWTTAGDYTVTFAAFNTDHPEGVATNFVVQVVPLIPPAISVGGMNGSSFSLNFFAQQFVIYAVEQTTNLTPPIAWSSVTTISGNDQTVQVTDASATNMMRFYRVRTQ
jgi:hypothetical protein